MILLSKVGRLISLLLDLPDFTRTASTRVIITTDPVHPLTVQGLMSQLSQPLSVGYVAPNTDVTANKLNKNNEEDQASVYPHSPQVSILIKLLSEIRDKLTF